MPSEMVFLLVDEVLTSRILIVSNHASSGESLEEMLCHEGFESITLVSSVDAAKSMLQPFFYEDSLPMDLIIYDSEDMEEEKWVEEIWKAKETFEPLDIPLVATGDLSHSQELNELIETGCLDYIQKPIVPINLVARLKTILNLKQTNRKLRKHQQDLQKLTIELEEKNRRLNSVLEDIRFDLQLAGELQRSFLPSAELQSETAEFASFYQPCETIGGDLINVLPVSSRYYVVYLLDVAGHGVSAALSAFSIHRYLTSECNHSLIKRPNGKVRSPAEVLKSLNKDFLMRNEWFKYFTITYGIFDAKQRTFRYCRAGQTPLLVIRNNESAEFVSLGSPPVGISKIARFTEFKLQLSPGDRVYLYSDGFTEAQNRNHEFYGEEQLLFELRSLKEKSLQSQVNKFTKRFFKWLGDERPRDDLALLAMFIK